MAGSGGGSGLEPLNLGWIKLDNTVWENPPLPEGWQTPSAFGFGCV